jgi:general secretion pathway protein C
MDAPRRLRLGLELTLLACVVLLGALAIRTGIRTAVAVVPPPAAARGPSAPPHALRPLEAYEPIAARDIFNAGTFGSGANGGPSGLVLLGVGLNGEAAHAVIEDPATSKQTLVRVGDELRGLTVSAIGWDEVTLSGEGGVRETLELARERRPKKAPPAETVTAAAGTTPAPAIRQTADDAYLIDRRQLDTTLDGLSGLMTELRAVPEMRDGRSAGFRIFQLRDDGLFSRLGLENGDVVERVNGESVAEPAALLGFLERLKTEPRVAIDIVRAGSARTLVYDLR